jgi:hypothetical protein
MGCGNLYSSSAHGCVQHNGWFKWTKIKNKLISVILK